MLLLSACAAPARQDDDSTAQAIGDVTAELTTISAVVVVKTKTIKIDGILYRNNFQGNLVFKDPQYERTPVFEKGANRYFRLKCEQYDLVYNVNVREIGTGESVYCRNDQWQQLHAYYANPKNFTYECSRRESGAAKLAFYSVPDMDIAKLDALVEYCNRNDYDPYGSHSGVKTRRVPYSVSREPELRFGKLSKDELFSEGVASFFIWEGKLLLEWYTYSDDYMLAVDVPDELSQYFIALVKNIDTKHVPSKPINESTTNTYDWKKLLNIEDHPSPFWDTASLLAGVEKLKKQATETGERLDDRLFCIPSILKKSQTSPVSVKLKQESIYVLEYYSQESIKSSITQLRYTPFIVDFQIMSDSQMQNLEKNIDMSLVHKYRFDDAIIYLATKVQGDGLMMFNMACYRQNTPILFMVYGYIYPPHEPDDIISEKIYQDFKYVPLTD